jgi:oxygen-independent coproporphyrinogen III oxidase
MKHQSESFNKRSRLIVAPAVDGASSRSLAPLQPHTLKARLLDVLRIQQDFYPCFDWVFPPPVFPKAAPPADAAALFAQPSVMPGTYSLYLHIPFCKTLCSFCYFHVLPGRGDDEKAAYVGYVLREMALYREALKDQRCESIYIGGTPIALLKSLGVNRLSYGIQSLDEKMLAKMNRHYRVADAIEELSRALPVIGNINVDTMYGFDDEPDDALPRTLRTFERLGIPCLTIYALDVQRSVRNTVWLGPPRDPRYFRKIEIYQQARALLASLGYEALFQNTFAKPGQGSYRHQLRRWENVSLVALGIGAMGYAPRRPYQNVGTTRAYFERLDAGVLPIESIDRLDAEMELARQAVTQLRLARLDLRAIRETYGVDLEVVFGDLLRVLDELGFIERSGDEVWLSCAAAPYNNVLPMLFSPDSFKQELLGLPEDYLGTMPMPMVLTQVGATQSAPFGLTPSAATP